MNLQTVYRLQVKGPHFFLGIRSSGVLDVEELKFIHQFIGYEL